MIPRTSGNILRFPGLDPLTKPPPAAPAPPGARLSGVPRYFSEVQELGTQGVSDLLGLTQGIIQRANRLIEYMDENRDEARMSGVETIAIELSAILEGGRLQRIEKALEESVQTADKPQISIDGFSKLRRAEFLVIEADKAIDRQAKTPILGQAQAPGAAAVASSSTSRGESISLILFGVIGAGVLLTVIILAMTGRNKVRMGSDQDTQE